MCPNIVFVPKRVGFWVNMPKHLHPQKVITVELRLSGLINVKGGPDKQISG